MPREILRSIPREDHEPRKPRIERKQPPKDAVAAEHEATMREIEETNALRRKGVKNPEAMQAILADLRKDAEIEQAKLNERARKKTEDKEIEIEAHEIEEVTPAPPPLPVSASWAKAKKEHPFTKEEEAFFEAGERGEARDRSFEESIPNIVAPRRISKRTAAFGSREEKLTVGRRRSKERGLTPLAEEREAAQTITVEDYIKHLALYGVSVQPDGDVGFWSRWKHRSLYAKSKEYQELFDDYIAEVERERIVSSSAPVASRIGRKRGQATVFTKEVKGEKGTGESGETIVGFRR